MSILALFMSRCREATQSDRSTVVNLNSCLCEGSDGSASPHVPRFLGGIGGTSYSCTDLGFQKSSPLSICIYVDSEDFAIHQLIDLTATHITSGSVFQVLARDISRDSSSIGDQRAEVHVSRDQALMVVQINQLDDAWFTKYSESSIDIRGGILIHPRKEDSTSRLFRFVDQAPTKSRKEFHLNAQTVAAASPLQSTVCSCSPIPWKLGDPKNLGVIHPSQSISISYTCDEGNLVSKGVDTKICLSLGQDFEQDYHLQRLLSFKLTHPMTGSVIRSISSSEEDVSVAKDS
jgi:hypothetical protein